MAGRNFPLGSKAVESSCQGPQAERILLDTDVLSLHLWNTFFGFLNWHMSVFTCIHDFSMQRCKLIRFLPCQRLPLDLLCQTVGLVHWPHWAPWAARQRKEAAQSKPEILQAAESLQAAVGHGAACVLDAAHAVPPWVSAGQVRQKSMHDSNASHDPNTRQQSMNVPCFCR